MSDYQKAKDLNLTKLDRWTNGIEHHPMSERIMNFLMEHDFNDYNDYFCWKKGGDGDNGETLMYQMDAFFELDETSLTRTRKAREGLKEGVEEILIGLEDSNQTHRMWAKDSYLKEDRIINQGRLQVSQRLIQRIRAVLDRAKRAEKGEE